MPGVANVAIWGQRDKQFQVLVDPDRLRANGVTLDAVVQGGRRRGGARRRRLRRHAEPAAGRPAPVADPRAGRPGAARSSTSAAARRCGSATWPTSSIGSPPPIGDAVINDGPGLLLIVEKQPEGNTLEVTREVEAALEALKPGLADVEIDPTIFRPATFIERALDNLDAAPWLIGCGLVVVILVAFLFDWRTAAHQPDGDSAVAGRGRAACSPGSGATINTMVLAGLVIALGEVVDDAIIDVENIVRRLRLNRRAGNPQSAFRVVLDASLEVRSAVVYASLIVMLVFLPIFFLDGLAGAFFRPLAAGLRPGDPGVAARRADRHAGAVVHAADRPRSGSGRRRRWRAC